MISSIFEKTKPINFIILMVFLVLFYGVAQFYVLDSAVAYQNVAPTVLALLVLLGSIFVVDALLKDNRLTKANSLGIFYFALLFVLFPESLTNSNSIFANIFLLLAFRRLFSIKSHKNSRLKIFDAGFLICIATIFNQWAILYLLLVVAAIITYEPKNLRNWLVVLVVGFSFFVILLGVLSLANATGFIITHYDYTLNLQALEFASLFSNLKFVLYIIFNFLLSFLLFIRLNKTGMGKVILMRLIAVSFLMGLLVTILLAAYDTSALLFTFFPSVVFIVNYLEGIKKPKVLEALLIMSILLPVLVFLTNL